MVSRNIIVTLIDADQQMGQGKSTDLPLSGTFLLKVLKGPQNPLRKKKHKTPPFTLVQLSHQNIITIRFK